MEGILWDDTQMVQSLLKMKAPNHKPQFLISLHLGGDGGVGNEGVKLGLGRRGGEWGRCFRFCLCF